MVMSRRNLNLIVIGCGFILMFSSVLIYAEKINLLLNTLVIAFMFLVISLPWVDICDSIQKKVERSFLFLLGLSLPLSILLSITVHYVIIGFNLFILGLFLQYFVQIKNNEKMPINIPEDAIIDTQSYISMNDDTRLNFLGDWITFGKYILSPGDILIYAGPYITAAEFFSLLRT